MSQENLIVVGRIGKAYGIKGWVKLQSFTEPAASIVDYQPWLVNVKGTWQAIKLETVKPHGDGLIAKFSGVDTPEATKTLTNLELGAAREQLPALSDDDYYWRDLEGLTVTNLEGVTLGTVDHMLATGANDVIVVKGTKEHLIPFLLKQFVMEIDLTKKPCS